MKRFLCLVVALLSVACSNQAQKSAPPPISEATVTVPALTPILPTGQATFTTPAMTATSTSTAASLKTARGVFIVTAHNVAIQSATYTNSAVDGIVIRTFWSTVQPAPDRFDWSLIDSQIQAASASGKKVILVVLPGAFTPQWALQGVQSAQFVVDYGFMQGTTVTLPMPWDSTYLNRWFAFVHVLGQRYDSNPVVVNVPAAGPTSISEEMSLPDDPSAVRQWKQLGYTLKNYEGAWQQTLATYVQSFPTTQISLTFYPGLPIPDASAKTATRVDVANFAFANYGQHVAFQENGLSARKAAASLGYDLVQQYSGKTTVGFEMGTSATEKPDQMGGTTAASALQASVKLGLQAGIQFLEIYEKDELNPDLQSILADTHSALTPLIVSINNTPAPPVLSPATQPRGITAVNNFEPSTRVGSLFDDRTYTNPNIAGLTFRTSWADIEPKQDNFVWTKLDTVFDRAEKNGKWVELVLIPGFGTPGWARQGVQTATFSVKYGPGKGEQLALPLPWDQTYLNRWFAFLQAVSARYQNRPSFIKIAADGPTSVTAEMSLPNEPADLCTWVKVGYTSDRLVGAWNQVFANYAQIFPRQYFSLALYPPPPIVSTTRCKNDNPIGSDHNESQRVRAAIVGLGANNYPKQFVLQTNGLTAAKEDPSTLGGYDLVKSYSGRVVIGFQLTTSAMSHPTSMGDADGVTALQESLQKGLDAHVQFLEVYEPDVLAPAAQNMLANSASALAH